MLCPDYNSSKIFLEARKWVGTRFHHRGRIKKSVRHVGGCDCLGLILGVGQAISAKSRQTGLSLNEHDIVDYKTRNVGNILKEALDVHLETVSCPLSLGMVALFQCDNSPQHLGIIAPYQNQLNKFSLIHAYIQARQVVEHYLDQEWLSRIKGMYRYYY